MKGATVTISVRLTSAELDTLKVIARKIGHGATVTGVIRQLIADRVDAERGGDR